MRPAKQKRDVRRSRRQSAWISQEGETVKHECLLMDLSPAGAKIFVEIGVDVADTFQLALVPYSKALRSCTVVWRRGRLMGIKFVT